MSVHVLSTEVVRESVRRLSSVSLSRLPSIPLHRPLFLPVAILLSSARVLQYAFGPFQMHYQPGDEHIYTISHSWQMRIIKPALVTQKRCAVGLIASATIRALTAHISDVTVQRDGCFVLSQVRCRARVELGFVA